MAKQTILKEKGTGEVMYPHTLASLVKMEDGNNAEDAIQKSKFALFVDMWNNACAFKNKDDYFGKYNEETGYFELNGITDISYEEALKIWRFSLHTCLTQTIAHEYLFGGDGWAASNNYYRCRTYFPITHVSYAGANMKNMFRENRLVEVIVTVGGYETSFGNYPILDGTFLNCKKLREISYLGYMSSTLVKTNAFENCESLETIKATMNGCNLNLKWSPKLSLESISQLIKNTVAPSTLTLHPDAFAKVTDELFAIAEEKNLQILTAE